MNHWTPEPVDAPLDSTVCELTPRLRFAVCLFLAVVVPWWLLDRAREELDRAPDDFGRAYWRAQCDELVPGLGDRLARWWEAAPL